MRYLMMPNDVGDFAYKLILPTIAAIGQVVVWRPALKKIDQMYHQGELPFDAGDFIWLVSNGYVVAAAREEWYAGPTERSANRLWESDSPWHLGKDEELRSIACKQYSSLPLLARNAIIAARPTGPDWAKNLVELEPRFLKLAQKAIRMGQLPSGFLQQASGLSQREAGLSALANSRNAAVAIKEVAANMSIEPSVHTPTVAVLGAREPNEFARNGDLPSNDSLCEVVNIFAAVSKFSSFKDWKKYLQSRDRLEVLHAVQPILMSESVSGDLISRLDEKKFSPSSREMLPKQFPELMATSSGIFLNILQCFLEAGLSFNEFGLVLAAAGISTSPLREIGKLQYPDRKIESIKFLFQYSHPKKSINKGRVDEMRKLLKSGEFRKHQG